MQFKSKYLRIVVYVLLFVLAVIILAYSVHYKRKNNIKPHIYDDISIHDLDIVYGNDSALLTIFMYSSYNCAFCSKFMNLTYPQLKSEYIDNGKIKLVIKFVEQANDNIVVNSLKIAACVNLYGDFEPLNTLLLTEPNIVYTNEFNEVVEELIDKDINIAECMIGGSADTYIYNNLLKFKSLKLTGTPTFIINNNIYKGYSSYYVFKQIIEKELLINL